MEQGISPITVGKRVSKSLYFHKSALDFIQAEEKKKYDKAIDIVGVPDEWNVVRFEPDNVAFLLYEDFEAEAFPALLNSCRVDFIGGAIKRRSFLTQQNPPILHRKELLLGPDYPNRCDFEKLTYELEELGLFARSHTIGFRDQWFERLVSAGVQVEGHQIIKGSAFFTPEISRHKTAMARYYLSKPMQLLMQAELISEARSILDYGCGQGDDVKTLENSGYIVTGWDPHYAPDSHLKKADVVNLGYVLNVIEDKQERVETLRKAWSYANGVLAISVMHTSVADLSNLRPYQDGYVTTKGTFQKYFAQDEIRQFLTQVLNENPVAVAQGIFFVFKDKLLEQQYLADKRKRKRQRSVNLRTTRERTEKVYAPPKTDVLRPQLEELWQGMLDQGRNLHEDELPSQLREALKEARVSLNRAVSFCQNELFDFEDLKVAHDERRKDLLVYFALALFSQRKGYTDLPRSLQIDVKVFFGSHANALNEAKDLLFSTGKQDSLAEAVDEAADEELGYIFEDGSFQFHSSVLDNLPPILRVYVGCGETLYGDVSEADLIKVHVKSKKLSLMYYDDFSLPLPKLIRRVKINLMKQRIDDFDYRQGNGQYLFMKSLFLPDGHEQYDEQSSFDNKLMKLKLFDFTNYGPDPDYFDQTIKENKVHLNGFSVETLN
jgi:DNA phosphorothioation-associated putative methyltransferase